MIDELKWMKTKLLKMEAIESLNEAGPNAIHHGLKRTYEKMGLFETLQIKSLNMYGHPDTIGFDILHNKEGLYGWKCGEAPKKYE